MWRMGYICHDKKYWHSSLMGKKYLQRKGACDPMSCAVGFVHERACVVGGKYSSIIWASDGVLSLVPWLGNFYSKPQNYSFEYKNVEQTLPNIWQLCCTYILAEHIILLGLSSAMPFLVVCLYNDLITDNKTFFAMITLWNGNIFRVTGHLCGEFTGHRWIPLTKASDAELWCFLGSAPEQTVG